MLTLLQESFIALSLYLFADKVGHTLHSKYKHMFKQLLDQVTFHTQDDDQTTAYALEADLPSSLWMRFLHSTDPNLHGPGAMMFYEQVKRLITEELFVWEVLMKTAIVVLYLSCCTVLGHVCLRAVGLQ